MKIYQWNLRAGTGIKYNVNKWTVAICYPISFDIRACHSYNMLFIAPSSLFLLPQLMVSLLLQSIAYSDIARVHPMTSDFTNDQIMRTALSGLSWYPPTFLLVKNYQYFVNINLVHRNSIVMESKL